MSLNLFHALLCNWRFQKVARSFPDCHILATCSGILKKFVFVSMENGLNWCVHARRSFFRTFYVFDLQFYRIWENRLRSSLFGTEQFRKDAPKTSSNIARFANSKHFEQCDRTARMVSSIHAYIFYSQDNPLDLENLLLPSAIGI